MRVLKVFQAKNGTATTGTVLVLTPEAGPAVTVTQTDVAGVVAASMQFAVAETPEFLPNPKTGRAWADWLLAHRPDDAPAASAEPARGPEWDDMPTRRPQLIKLATELGVDRPGLLDSDQLRAAIAAARPEVTVWALGQFEQDPGPDAPFDAVAVADAPPRGDPCAVFD